MKQTTALLVPVFNGEKFIDSFHASVTALTTQFDRILFYNDGSSDQSAERLRKLGYEVIDSAENKGQAAGRNILLLSVKTDWVHFHDIDDLMSPSYLAETMALTTPDCDAVICDADWVSETGIDLLFKWEYKNQLYASEGPAYLLRNPVGGINGLYRRKTLLEMGGFDEQLKIWEDSDMNLRLSLNGKKIIFTEKILVKAIRHAQSTSSNAHRIRAFQCSFLGKHLSVTDLQFREQLKIEANKLFHDIVYRRDWPLYKKIRHIFRELREVPPLTKTASATVLKRMAGPRFFTRMKLFYLQKFRNLKIHD